MKPDDIPRLNGTRTANDVVMKEAASLLPT
jgi:hypothetical protein